MRIATYKGGNSYFANEEQVELIIKNTSGRFKRTKLGIKHILGKGFGNNTKCSDFKDNFDVRELAKSENLFLLLPKNLKEYFLDKQESAGNKRNEKIFINNPFANKDNGGFEWNFESDMLMEKLMQIYKDNK